MDCFKKLIPLLFFLFVGGGLAAAADEKQQLPPQFARLAPLHEKLGPPRPGDWLAEHSEPGQTFRQYVQKKPVRADQLRRVIYVQPLGDFQPDQQKIVDGTAEFLGIYFQLPVKVRERLSLDVVPATERRKPGDNRSEQLLAPYVLYEVLRPRIPGDAVTYLGLTTSDLWPGEGWNYCFGLASLRNRVGVWSFNRFGDPTRDAESFRRCLRRTLKTAVHETGHMFSMAHCTQYNCVMCGSNHLPEADRRPLEPCPHCLAKLCYATGADPVKRFEQLIKFHRANGLTAEREFCEKSLEILWKK